MVGGVLMSIVLENERINGYAAGESVTGQVVLQLLEDVQVLGLHLHAGGGAFVSLTVKREEEWFECLNEEMALMATSTGETQLFTAGSHNLPFHFRLPDGPLVTSFSGRYGRVHYELTAVLERPLLPAYSVHRELRITNRIDVNSPPLLASVQRYKEKMVGCWLCTSGPISLSAKIGRKGYCNGEAIPIYAEIENGSSRLVVPKAAIFQIQSFIVDGKMKQHRQMLARVRGNHIASGSTETWNGKTLKIPPVTPTIVGCPIIHVEYVLAVYIHIPGAKKLMVELPLVIGTVPFNGFLYRNSSAANQFTVDMSWLALTLPEQPEAPPNYADIVSEEELSWTAPIATDQSDLIEGLNFPPFTVIQEFRFQPPPLYSEVDPHPNNDSTEQRTASFILEE
ncbi:arrestin domain-containing protein 4 [Hyla sarda]|uniref:arrestin domain-containing protein 4 n=1 Tax=Hyla sarda TaxID=327740 RepID=UPI0024C3D370|nr:arrestin domain-containing protein 4 [Hyla sarda]